MYAVIRYRSKKCLIYKEAGFVIIEARRRITTDFLSHQPGMDPGFFKLVGVGAGYTIRKLKV